MRRPSRGTTAGLIEEILRAAAPRAMRQAEMRAALSQKQGKAIAFTSIRHALSQLEGRGVVERVADSKTWRATQP